MPTADEAKAFLADTDAEEARQADRRAARDARVRRLLDAQVGRRARSSRKTIQVEGELRLPGVAPRGTSSENTPFDEVVQRTDHRQRQHLRQPAGQLLPHRQGPAEPGRDDGAALPRRPDAVREVPQPPVRALDAGRLLQHGRVLRPGEDRSPSRSSARSPPATATDAAEVVFAARDGEVTQPRTGKTMKPRFLGVGDAGREPGEDRRDVLADVADRGRTTRSSRSRSSTASGST